MTTIVLPQDNGTLQVVVRGVLQHRFMPGYSLAMDGFYKHPDGTVSPMRDKELYAFD